MFFTKNYRNKNNSIKLKQKSAKCLIVFITSYMLSIEFFEYLHQNWNKKSYAKINLEAK